MKYGKKGALWTISNYLIVILSPYQKITLITLVTWFSEQVLLNCKFIVKKKKKKLFLFSVTTNFLDINQNKWIYT